MTAAITVAIGAGFLAMVAFVGLYWRSDWRHTSVGRNLMALPAVLGALLGAWLLARVAGPLPVWLWLAGIVALDGVMWWRVWILWRLQHDEGQ